MRDTLLQTLRVQQHCLNQVKLELRRKGFSSQRSLAKDTQFTLATVSNFLTGKPVEKKTFEELCHRLSLDWQEIAALNYEISSPPKDKTPVTPELSDSKSDTSPSYPNGAVPLGSSFYLERVPL
jgi:hypothetical protein